MPTRLESNVVYAAGGVQGNALVTFPAATWGTKLVYLVGLPPWRCFRQPALRERRLRRVPTSLARDSEPRWRFRVDRAGPQSAHRAAFHSAIVNRGGGSSG
jgi:hypothetical protein